MLRTRFTDLLGCALPVQQAPMGGISDPALALAVCEAGGLGMLAAATVPVGHHLAAMGAAAGRPYGVNFLVPFAGAGEVEQAAAAARLVEFFYGDPDPQLVATVHRGGALAGWQVGSVEEARVAADAGCDVVVAQGVEAGGHVRGSVGLLPLLAEVLDAVEVPVVAAGGIATPRALAAVLAAGADAARVGTLLLATEEADVHPAYRDAVLAAGAGDTALTTAFSLGWPDAPHRVLRSALEAAERSTAEVVGTMPAGDDRLPVPRLSAFPPSRGTDGDVAAMALYCGQGVGTVREVRPAGEVVRHLAEEAERLLRASAPPG